METSKAKNRKRVTVARDVSPAFVRAAVEWARIYASGDLSRMGEALMARDRMEAAAVASFRNDGN